MAGEIENLRRERDEAVEFIERRGYRRCDIPACNCGSWHDGYAERRLREIRDLIDASDFPADGVTTFDAVTRLLAEREDRQAEHRHDAAALADLAKRLQAVVVMLMPGIRNLAGVDFALLNRALLDAREMVGPRET